MPCYKKSTQINTIYFGDERIAQVYKGDILVFTDNTIIYLGEGQTFDVAAVYSDYKKLTADNFFILSASTVTSQISCSYYEPATDNWVHGNGGLEKSYNASTGKLTCRLYSVSECATIGTKKVTYGNVKAVLVTNLKKLVKLEPGSNSSSDPNRNNYFLPVSDFPEFNSYGVNNFLIKSTKVIVQPTSFHGGTVTPQTRISIAKNYSKTANTGTLNTYIQIEETIGGTTNTLRYWVEPYLCRQGVVTT